MFRCVHNASINHLKTISKFKQHVSTEYLENVKLEFFDEIVSKEQCAKIESAIEELPNQCRKVIEMSRIEGMSYKEIAEKLNISHRTVDTHITKATKILRQKLIDFSGSSALLLMLLTSKM